MRGRQEADTAPRDTSDHHTTIGRRRPRPDPSCGNCDGRGCILCVCREVHDRCVDDCPTCCEPGMYRPRVYKTDNDRYGWAVERGGHTYPFGAWAPAVDAAVNDALGNCTCLCWRPS